MDILHATFAARSLWKQFNYMHGALNYWAISIIPFRQIKFTQEYNIYDVILP